MANNQTLRFSVNLCLWVLVLSFSWFPFLSSSSSSSYDDNPSSHNSFIISSFDYSKSKLDPFEWRYIRVDLPDWFSLMSLKIESDVDINEKRARKLPKSKLPIICFRDGSPPLPDASNNSINNLVLSPLTNGSDWGIQDLQNVEQCHLLQKHITLNLTNNQISPGIWYFGIYNGIGPLRTQSKMITRGSSYTFSASVTVEGCETSTMWGPYCNQTVDSLSCAQSNVYNLSDAIHNQTIKNVITCRNSYDNACHRSKELKVYFMDILGIAEQLTITATDFRFNGTSSTNNTGTFSGNLMCYARHGAMPSSTLHDYSSHISEAPLVILSPKIGRWYFAILPISPTAGRKLIQDNKTNIDCCYSLDGQIQECPLGKAGPNCTWKIYTLQTILRKNPSVPFESYYLPVSERISPLSANFLLEPLLSNSSFGDKFAWTCFILDIPFGAAGGNIHIQLTSDVKIDYEIYSRFGGLPSLETWDYYYANGTSSSNHSMFFQVYDSSDVGVSFSILYAREGTWSFGLRHRFHNGSPPKQHTSMSISIQRCPKQCSGHGECRSFVDLGGLALYSYCACDRNHGGFDCSIEIVSHRGHILQSIALIASNAAAILPAFWALRHKAFAEWVLFTSSGISSGLYHACDVGTWCVLNFHVLQFMDFWLSFMAVVSTFVYLSTVDDDSKRPIHTTVSILTALMAITGPTRPINIILVIAIGAVVLLIGWLLEYSTAVRSLSCSTWVCLNILERWESIKVWFYKFIQTLRDRFRWGFVIMGVIALSLAGLSWKLETSETYWIWHSFWHVTIYTSSFFFLCSKVNKDNQETSVAVYELTRQDSFSRTTV